MARGEKPTNEERNDGTWAIGITHELHEHKIRKGGSQNGFFVGCIPAFTATELGELLPVPLAGC